ncbi:MAG: HEAT repeat domain-containing protein, partial [Methanothrix sp.]|nr:HEAT repeat domain-containing protein [Methanothrix sp.]
DLNEQVPNELHEIVTGRFSTAWTVEQVSVLLKKSSAKKIAPPSPPPTPLALEAVPVSQDLIDSVKELTEYTPEEMEVLKSMSEAGMESDIIDAAVRTLIFMLSLVKSPDGSAPGEKEIKLFSGVVRQLEDMLNYLLKKKDYDLAGLIIRVFRMPVDPAFKPRLAEAEKKTSSKTAIAATISDLRKYPKDSPEYLSAHSYLSVLEREVTEVLLELLAEETDRSAREFLMDMLKDLGKHQLMVFGEHLSDERWYFVRNIVNILGNSKTDDAIAFLYKVSGHKNVRIRQEVVKGLLSIGGKKAAGLLAKFLNDKDAEIQLMAIRGFAVLEGIGAHEAKSLLAFLEGRPIKKREKELTIEAITVLAKIGGPDAGEFLARYNRIRWWKPRKLQLEVRAAAQRTIDEIKRRAGDGGRTTR